MLNHTRTILLTAIVAVLVAAPVAAAKKTHAAKTNHEYTSTVMASAVWTANGYPSPGGYAVLSGTVLSPQFGPGTVIDTVAVTGQPSPNVFTFNGTEVDHFADGSLRNNLTGTATVQDDGSQTIVIKGRFTRGTRSYTGATGGYTFTGTIAPGSNVVIGTSSGSLVF